LQTSVPEHRASVTTFVSVVSGSLSLLTKERTPTRFITYTGLTISNSDFPSSKITHLRLLRQSPFGPPSRNVEQ